MEEAIATTLFIVLFNECIAPAWLRKEGCDEKQIEYAQDVFLKTTIIIMMSTCFVLAILSRVPPS